MSNDDPSSPDYDWRAAYVALNEQVDEAQYHIRCLEAELGVARKEIKRLRRRAFEVK